MGKLAVPVSFHHYISSICRRKMPQIDPEVKNLNFFFVFDAISIQFPRDFVLRKIRFTEKMPTQSTNNKRTSFALHFLKRALQRFASKTLQNDSKGVEKFQHHRFVQLLYLLNSFGVRMLANVQQSLNS